MKTGIEDLVVAMENSISVTTKAAYDYYVSASCDTMKTDVTDVMVSKL